MAETLGVEPARLVKRESVDTAAAAPEPSSDSAKVEALIAERGQMVGRDELAAGLGWDPLRVRRALEELRARLEGTGQRLQVSWGVDLRPRDLFSGEEVKRMEHAALARAGLKTSDAKLLRRVAAGEIDSRWEAKAGNAQRVSLGHLLKLRLIRKKDGRYVLAEDVAYSLEDPDAE